MTSVQGPAPAAIDAVPLRHPWRWVAAGAIVVLVGLFIYGAATNKAYGWSTYGEYLFNDRILLGVWNTLQLTVYAMAIGVVHGCDGCIASHAHGAAKAGASKQQAAEAIGVAIMMHGGPATVYGARAYDAFCEFADAD